MPVSRGGETVYVVSMEKNFHVHCYKCEDCETVLSHSSEGAGTTTRGCYPLAGRLFCFECNAISARYLGEEPKAVYGKQISTEL